MKTGDGNLRTYVLGDKAVQYIESRLSLGKTFATLLLEKVDLKKGTVKTLLPEGFSEVEVNEFNVGGKLSQPSSDQWRYTLSPRGELLRMTPVPNTDAHLRGQISSFLLSRQNSICIFEDANMLPSDPTFRSLRTRHAEFNDDVYHYLLMTDSDNQITLTLKEAKSWLLIGAMCTCPRAWSSELSNLTQECLMDLAQRAEQIIVNAYDGEGYLVWEK